MLARQKDPAVSLTIASIVAVCALLYGTYWLSTPPVTRKVIEEKVIECVVLKAQNHQSHCHLDMINGGHKFHWIIYSRQNVPQIEGKTVRLTRQKIEFSNGTVAFEYFGIQNAHAGEDDAN